MFSAKRSINSLPEDLILEIFLRLPWKSFLRCRFVSKRLRDSIDCPLFLKRYDLFHNHVSDFALMHIRSGRLFSIDYLFTNSLISSKKIEICLPNTITNPVFIGCCNGIVCLMVSPETETECYILLNPFNRTFLNVDRTDQGPLKSDSYSIGLGYDSATDDYKIMRMERVTKSDVQRIDVYSLRRNSWKQLDGVFSTGSGSFAHLNGICVDSAIHWLWLNDVNDYSSIAAFDLRTEFLRVVPLPPHLKDESLSLYDLGGRLSVFAKSRDGRSIVWVKEEKNGVDEASWTWVMNSSRQPLNICYFPMQDCERFLCFEPHFGSKNPWINLQGCSMNREIYNVPVPSSYEDQPWVCVRSAFRLPCSHLQIN